MLVSVIMPTYNRADYLKRAMQSALKQSFTDYEIIVVDDGSRDKTEDVVANFGSKVRYKKLFVNSGGSMLPRQVGLEMSQAEYVAMLDDDDFWVDRSKLSLQVAYLESHPNCVLVGTDAITFDEDDKVKMYHNYPKSYREVKTRMLLYNCFYHSSVMFRREAFEKIGGYREIRGGRYTGFSNDYDLWLRMGTQGEIINLPIYGVGHVYSPTNLSSKDRVYYMVKQLELINKYRRDYPNYLLANVVKCIFSLVELPLIRTAKNGFIKD